MGRYLIIENEDFSYKMIKEQITSFDPEAQIDRYSDLADLVRKNSQREKVIEPNPKIDLILIGTENFNPFLDETIKNQTALIIKTLKIPQELTPTLLISGYEHPSHTPAKMRSYSFYNFIFKPFDPLILKESLFMATQQKTKAKNADIKTQQAKAFVALLKEIEIQSLSEVGFVTTSESPIPEKTVCKYVSPLFQHGKKQSIWAQCLMSVPHPQKEGSFINKFQFLAPSIEFLNQIRRYALQHKKSQGSPQLWSLINDQTTRNVKIGIAALPNDENNRLIKDLEMHFNQVEIEYVKLEVTKGAEQVLLEHDIVINLTDLDAEKLKTFFKPETKFFAIKHYFQSEEELQLLSSQYTDLFIFPLDRSYFYKKLKIHFKALIEEEPSQVVNIICKEKIKAAHKVKISEISELSISLFYHRELDFKEFREFIFINDDELQIIELPAFVHFSEKVQGGDPKDKNNYHVQFLFFGMTDHQFKQIRIWLLHNYIVQNKQAS